MNHVDVASLVRCRRRDLFELESRLRFEVDSLERKLRHSLQECAQAIRIHIPREGWSAGEDHYGQCR
jgi:hypothetical protein